MPQVLITCQVDHETREALLAVAQRQDRGLSSVMRQAIRSFLKRKQPVSPAVPPQESAGGPEQRAASRRHDRLRQA
jgi:hypothetical protein